MFQHIERAIADVLEEVRQAEAKFPGFNSAHEGHSVLREEVDELWDHVKGDTGYSDEAYAEAKQVAAMGIRYMLMVRGRQARGRAQERGTR
jgi:hypothetical protein